MSDNVTGVSLASTNNTALGINPLQQIDTDIQRLIVSVNNIATLLSPTPQVVTGSRTGGAALTSLLAALAAAGLIVNDTTP
jgi:hypothetical protein